MKHDELVSQIKVTLFTTKADLIKTYPTLKKQIEALSDEQWGDFRDALEGTIQLNWHRLIHDNLRWVIGDTNNQPKIDWNTVLEEAIRRLDMKVKAPIDLDEL